MTLIKVELGWFQHLELYNPLVGAGDNIVEKGVMEGLLGKGRRYGEGWQEEGAGWASCMEKEQIEGLGEEMGMCRTARKKGGEG
jgi:hypothetical protein